MSSSDNKRLAKNTLILYIRTIFVMLVSLYTSRVILHALGVEDYGINNVIGGLVSMFSVMSSSLCSAISRFMTFGLGKGDIHKLKSIFATSVNIQLGMALLVLIVGSIVGYFFLNYKMSIPANRLYAANWVLFCSLLSFAISLISVPYNSCIIAHEKMDAFAYISILETVLKLVIVYMIYISPYDKLITYTLLFLASSCLIRYIYTIYCKRNFEECQYELKIDRSLLKEMTSFAGWNFFGNTAYMLNTQGVNMLINVFFGVTMNAARGVAIQVQNAILQFVNNFTTAINPQITKSYATGNYTQLHKLICQGAKYTYYLLLIFTIPVFVEADTILKIWLGIVPEYTTIFLRLILISSYATILGNTAYTAIMATGQIKNYQLVVTLVGCLVFPLTWILYKLDFPVTSTYYIYILTYIILVFIRLYYLKKLVNLSPIVFIRTVIIKIFILSVPSFAIPFIFIQYMEASFIRVVFTCIISVTTNVILIYYLGLDKNERKFITEKIKAKLKNKSLCH